jgi:hypothetical protein
VKRLFGILLSIVGLLGLIAAVVLLLVAPQLIRLPDRGSLPTTVLEAKGATVMQAGPGTPQAVQTDLRTTIKVKADGRTGDAVVWSASEETVVAATGTPLSASQTRIALDDQSGAAVPWSGQCLSEPPAPCTPGNVQFAGQLYQFPIGTEKTDHQFFDTTLRTALPIAYQGTEDVNGLSTYRFEQAVPEQQSAPDPQLLAALTAGLPPALKEAAAGAKIGYQTTRTVWVEPATGAIVNYREQMRRAVVLPIGQRIPLLTADFQYTEQTRTDLVGEASDARAVIRAVRWYLPAGLAVFGLVCLLIGLLLMRRRRTPSGTPPAAAPAAAQPGESTDAA